MDSIPDTTNDLTIPPQLQAEILALAAATHRPPDEIVCEALENYLARQKPPPNAATRAAAVARIRARRIGNRLPEGMTIRAMIDEGRK
jgi:predicted transcriptional regulator